MDALMTWREPAAELSLGNSSGPVIAVAAVCPAFQQRAATLARSLCLPWSSALDDPRFNYLLALTPERLELRSQTPAGDGPIYVDFLAKPAAYRRRFGGGRRQPLARAIGLKGNIHPYVLDATAGLGRDAFVLACLGCTVQLVERSPLIGALLRDGLERAARAPETAAVVTDRMSLTVADSRVLMRTLDASQRPDVVYLDPMYPERAKSALVKKEMRLLRRLVSDDSDAPALLTAALDCACRRVVVKRPRRAPSLDGPAPSLHIASANTRFDVYLL